MIELIFSTGGAIRKVYINGRKVSLLTAETNFVPVEINLDKISNKLKKRLSKEEINLLKEISLLKTEQEMARDIIKDFQKSGWRLTNKYGTN